MKIAELVKFSTPSTTFDVYPDGSESAALFYGGEKVLSIGRVRFGNFDESLGLAEKLRRHLLLFQSHIVVVDHSIILVILEQTILFKDTLEWW